METFLDSNLVEELNMSCFAAFFYTDHVDELYVYCLDIPYK